MTSGLEFKCGKEIEYTIEIPTSWVLKKIYTCNGAEFRSRDEKAYVQVNSHHLPLYSNNPREAFRQVSEDFSSDYAVEDVLGGTTKVKVLTSKHIQHRGQDALWQTLEATSDRSFIYCKESLKRLVVLSKGWSSREQTKRAYFVTGGRCRVDPKYDDSLERSLKSFTPFIP